MNTCTLVDINKEFGISDNPQTSHSMRPKKYNYIDRKIAQRILKRHSKSSIDRPTVESLEKLNWAKDVLPNYSHTCELKRPCSQEVEGLTAKRVKILPTKSFDKLAKEKILIGILDQGSGNGGIPRKQWKWVEGALAVHCFELLATDPGPPPICKDLGWYQGNIKIIACDNMRTVELYKAAVEKLGEIYTGAKLIVVGWHEVPKRLQASIEIPATITAPDCILKMLQRCNPQLSTHGWRVANVENTKGPTNKALLILNKESLAPIKAANGELNFGFSSVNVHIYNSDQHLTSEIEPEGDGYSSDVSSLARNLRGLRHQDDENDSLLEGLSDDGADDIETLEQYLSFDVVTTLAVPPSR